VAVPWAENQVLVRFSFSAPFYAVSKLLARVSWEAPGDSVSYFAFTLSRDTGSARPGPMLLRTPVEVRWDGQSSVWGEGIIGNVLMVGDTSFWGALNWPENSPTNPRIGDDRSINLFFRSYIGYQDSFFLWTNGGNLMIRAQVLINDAANEMADSFWVYRGSHRDSVSFIQSVGGDQFDYLDTPPGAGVYYYKVTRWENDEESPFSNAFPLTASPTAVQENQIDKHTFLLSEPFPNPTSACVLFTARTDKQMQLGFSIYNLLGQRVFSKPTAGYPAGEHLFFWNGQDGSGWRLPSGLYLLRFQAGEEFLVKKATLLR